MENTIRVNLDGEMADFVDQLVRLRLEEILEITEDEEENQAVYEATKVLVEFFGGDVDEY
jgi:hypothetical protein